jgi:transcriptional repressor NrdR
VKKDGRRENFDRDKLRMSIERAAERTSIDRDRARKVAERVAERIERDARDAMPTTEIRERLLRELDREERVIADEFRSYRRFGF